MKAQVETYDQYPFKLVEARNVIVKDSDGKEYIDFYGGHAVCSVGHSNLKVIDAIHRQAEKFMFYSNLADIPFREEAARELINFSASRHSRVFFCNSGGEANENALKIAIKSTGRFEFACLKGGFHGRTTLSMTVTDNPKWHEQYAPRLMGVRRFCPNDVRAVDQIVDERVAAVIVEPIQSIGGVVELTEEFLRSLRAKCNQTGALLIFDEVQTGVGRTGRPYVSSVGGVESDISTSAKGLANGYPIGAVLIKESVHDNIEKGDLGATFGGGPVALAAMKATISEIIERNLMDNAICFENSVKDLASKAGLPGVKGKGCLLGISMGCEAAPIQKELFRRGIIVGLCTDPTILHLLPPLTIKKDHVNELFIALEKVL